MLAQFEENSFSTLLPTQHQFEFILNASLDQVDMKQWHPTASQNMAQAFCYLGNIDKYNEMFVSCF